MQSTEPTFPSSGNRLIPSDTPNRRLCTGPKIGDGYIIVLIFFLSRRVDKLTSGLIKLTSRRVDELTSCLIELTSRQVIRTRGNVLYLLLSSSIFFYLLLSPFISLYLPLSPFNPRISHPSSFISFSFNAKVLKKVRCSQLIHVKTVFFSSFFCYFASN